MITWITGESGSGKSYVAKAIHEQYGSIWLDGDMMRRCWKIGFSEKDRFENNMRIAKIAREIDEQGYDVVVSTICPTKKIRNEVKKITRCKFIDIK